MKKSRFTEEQIIAVLRELDAGRPTDEVCRRRGISRQNFYRWKAKYRGMGVSDTQRLKMLEDENRRLKKLLAESMLDGAALKDLLGKTLTSTAARRVAVLRLIAERGFFQRGAGGVVQIDPKTVRRTLERGDGDVRERLRSLAAEQRPSATGGWASCRRLGTSA